MATPTQLTRRSRREVRHIWQNLNWLEAENDKRRNDDDTWAGDDDFEDDFERWYSRIDTYLEPLQVFVREHWRKLRRWSRNHPSIPDEFEDNLGPQQLKLRKIRFCNNALTVDQEDNTTAAEEPFSIPPAVTRWEAIFELLDSFSHWSTGLTRRCAWWVEEWVRQGSTDIETEVQAVWCELQDATSVARTLIADLAQEINTRKAAGVPELRLRKRLLKLRPTIAGGIFSMNYGQTPGGSGPDPDDYDPDINVVRDEPDLGTDPMV